jgi:hypothetical protein
MTKEMLPQNKRPLSQASKRAMESLKYPISPATVYPLQLAIAAMEDGIAGGQGDRDDDRILLEHLEKWSRDENPKTVMDRLTEAGGLDTPETIQLAQTDPADFAATIVGAFSDLLMDLLPGYGMGRTPPGYRAV